MMRRKKFKVIRIELKPDEQFETLDRMLAGRGGGPHLYEIGADWVQRYFQVMQGFARAAQLKLEQQLETAKR